MIRKLSAHYLFPVSQPPIKYGIIVCSSSGEIIEIVDPKGQFREVAALEFYDGILVPGFIKDLNNAGESVFNNLKQQFLNDQNLTLLEALQANLFIDPFEVGKAPGINLISPVDFGSMRLLPGSKLRTLIL